MTRCLIVIGVLLTGCTGAIAPESTGGASINVQENSANASALNEPQVCPEGDGALTVYSNQVAGDNNTNHFYRIRFRNMVCDDIQVIETNALPETYISKIGVGDYIAEIYYLDDSSGEDIQIGATTAAFEIRSGQETEIDLGFPGG